MKFSRNFQDFDLEIIQILSKSFNFKEYSNKSISISQELSMGPKLSGYYSVSQKSKKRPKKMITSMKKRLQGRLKMRQIRRKKLITRIGSKFTVSSVRKTESKLKKNNKKKQKYI